MLLYKAKPLAQFKGYDKTDCSLFPHIPKYLKFHGNVEGQMRNMQL
jgi:hypothetical protein